MDKWEYKTFQIYSASDNVFTLGDTTLEELGAQGWDLITVQEVNGGPMAFFKRKLTGPDPLISDGLSCPSCGRELPVTITGSMRFHSGIWHTATTCTHCQNVNEVSIDFDKKEIVGVRSITNYSNAYP